MRLPAAEPRSKVRLLFPSQYLSGTIWLTPYSMLWDWRVSRTGQCLFVDQAARSFFVFNYFPFLSFSSIGWQCGAGVFGLIGCQSPSPGLALPTFFNNNNINNTPARVTLDTDTHHHSSLELSMLCFAVLPVCGVITFEYIDNFMHDWQHSVRHSILLQVGKDQN